MKYLPGCPEWKGRCIRTGWLILLSLLFSSEATGQATGLSVSFYTSEDGLPHKHVYDITQDDYGFMWIATRNGLVRFDGYRFEDFTYAITGDNQLKGRMIYSLEKDRFGKIWIGYEEGVAVLDPFTGKATKQPLTGYNGVDPRVLWISIDQRGRKLISLVDDVLLCYDEDFRLVFSYELSIKNGKANPGLGVVLEDTDGTYWLPSYDYGLDHISAAGAFIEHYTFPEPVASATTFKTLTTNTGMVYTFPLGRRTEVGETNAPEIYPDDKNHVFMYRSYARPCRIPDRKGNEWIIDRDSITLKGPLLKKPLTFSLPYMEEFGQDHPMLNAFVGSDNTLWTASRKGIFKINYKPNPFRNYLNRDGLGITENGLSMRGMIEDAEGKIWVSLYPHTDRESIKRRNLFRIDPVSHQVETIYLHSRDTSQFRIHTLPLYKIIRQGSRFWATTGYTFIYQFDPKVLEIDAYKIPDTLLGAVTGILSISDSSLIFSTGIGSGIFRVTAEGKGIFKGLYDDSSGQIMEGINNFFEAGNKLIWAASNNGLFLLNAEGRILRSYALGDQSNVKLPALDINWVYPQPEQKIWLGSRHGLIMLDTIRGMTRLFTTDDGLPNNNVMSILPDESGSLWLSTDRGLSRFHPEHKSFVNYDVHDGLPHNEFNRMAALKSSNGRLYFGSLNGVTSFNPGEVDASLDQLMPLLTHYSYYQGRIDTVVNFDLQPDTSQTLEFTYLDRLFRFNFMLPSYRQPEKNRFLYMLEGWDKEWQSTNATHTISYNYLQPGEYTLRVKGAAAGYSWGLSEYRLSIVIRQAWYKTWWSISLGILAIGSFFYALYRYRLNALVRVQNIRNKISADLHDELGSVLTQIALQSDMVSRDIYSESEKQKELENIRDTSREAIHAMSDIVWSVSAGHDKTSSLLDRMRDHADLMLQPLHITPSFSVTGFYENKIMDNTLRQELFLIFKEAIHNIVKHSHPGYVDILLSNGPGGFEMRIRNDINKQGDHMVLGGHGTNNMQRRALSIHGTLSVRASANEYEVLLKRDEI